MPIAKAQNCLPHPKSLPWGRPFALDDRAVVVVRLEGQKLAGMLRHWFDPKTNAPELYTSGA